MALSLIPTPDRRPPAGTIAWLTKCIARGEHEKFSEETTLTPGLAQELLRRNPDNRNLRQFKIDHFAHDIAAGRWANNGEAIILSQCGLLNDGQHRCHAIIQANCPTVVTLAFGYERDTRLTVDQGSARYAGDYLTMDGQHYGKARAYVARQVIAFELSKGKNLNSARLVTNADILLRANSDEQIEKSAIFGALHNKKARYYIGPGPVGVAHYILSDINQAEADEFLEQVCLGENLKARDPASAVRDRLLAMGKASAQKKLYVIFRGWNAFRDGRKISTINLDGEGRIFPAIV